jgi:hypothetical protein
MKPELSVVGIDLAKSIFHLVGLAERGKIILRKRLARGEVRPFMAKLPRGLVGMEACGGAHYGARQWRAQGHEVQLMAPPYVKPSVKTNNNDLRDAEAIAEAVTRPSMRFVPIKKVEQQALQALPRVHARGLSASLRDTSAGGATPTKLDAPAMQIRKQCDRTGPSVSQTPHQSRVGIWLISYRPTHSPRL